MQQELWWQIQLFAPDMNYYKSLEMRAEKVLDVLACLSFYGLMGSYEPYDGVGEETTGKLVCEVQVK